MLEEMSRTPPLDPPVRLRAPRPPALAQCVRPTAQCAKCCSQHAPRRTRSLRSARCLSFFHSNRAESIRAAGVCLDLGHTHGTDGRTERAPPMGPPPTHVCLVRETRLLPPKAGRLASRSAKPTLDGSSLIRAPLLLLDHPLVVAMLALQPPVCPRPLGSKLPHLYMPTKQRAS